MDGPIHKQALPLGCRLQNYRVEDVLGVGGFGVTYLAAHATLGHKVAIKEYLPNEFAMRDGTAVHPKSEVDREDFDWGLARFLDEAKTLARFEHRNLVRVRDYFEANRTAYIVMDYEDGEPLDRLLERHGPLTEAQLKRVLLPIVDGLRDVHAAGFLHRDIKPSNVFVRRADESPVLLDFGAARQALGRKSKSLTAVASAGYSPPEQYESEGEQGPWTDIYALSALCYRAIAGAAPVEAPRRQSRLLRGRPDPLPKLAETVGDGYSRPLLEAVDLGLRVIETQRPASLDEWAALLDGASTMRTTHEGSVTPASPAPIVAKTGVGPPSGRSRGKAWAIGAGAVAAVSVALAVWLYPWNEAHVARDDASRAPIPGAWGEPPDAALSDTPSAPVEPPSHDDGAGLPPVGGGRAILVVETQPAGADVLIGDAAVGKTPLERNDIRAGTHVVTLRHPHYQAVRLDGQVFADGVVRRIERTLVPGTGKLTVVTQPRGAWIERDGKRLASRTPVTLEDLPAGPADLTLGAQEHRPVQVRVDIPKDGVGMLERTLERISYGSLTLDLVPPDATATLLDIAPVYRPGIRLPEGRHRVAVRRSGYREVIRTVDVAGNTRVRVELVLGPQPFTVAATPADAVVRLVNVEDDYRDGMQLEPGQYRVRVSASEYETVEETISHGTAPTRHPVVLARRPQPFTIVAEPAEATIRLADLAEGYLPGMRLAPGDYRVRVSAEGYATREDSVRHGAEPTRYPIELERSIPEPGGTFADALASGGKGPEMVVIPAGRFRMGDLAGGGDDDEKPIHEVTIPLPLALSKREVTFADWETCVNAGGCNRYRPDDRGWGRDNRPVIMVSWDDAQSYVSWLSRQTGEHYRLPSEAEWEYAARAASATKYSWGNDIGRNRANCDGCGSRWDNDRTAPVGSFNANAFGLHDMHGNVWEWVQDCWNGGYAGAPSDGSAWERGDCATRVLRGGSWFDIPRNLRSANRVRDATSFRFIYDGFRVARTLTP